MNIAVIGTGSVGGTLGRRWAELGHSVRFGVRDTTDAAANALVSQINGDARVAGVRDAAAAAEVVVLATPYEANAAAISAAGDLTGKVSHRCHQSDHGRLVTRSGVRHVRCRGTGKVGAARACLQGDEPSRIRGDGGSLLSCRQASDVRRRR